MADTIEIAHFPFGVDYAAKELALQVLDFTRGTGASGGVVGLSGGVDSTTVAYLTKFAFDEYNRQNSDKEQLKLLGVIMPSRSNSPKDEEDGLRVAKSLGIESKVVSIEPIAKSFLDNITEIDNDFDKGNLYSETRAIILSRLGAAKNYRVMGTGNRDEDYVLGYFTKRGDGAVDNNIIGNLPKRLVRELASYLGVPKDLVLRVPTAGLWVGQTDEKELGYTYDEAEIIFNGLKKGLTPEKINQLTGLSIKKILDVKRRNLTTEHKRNLPPVGKVSLVYKNFMEVLGK